MDINQVISTTVDQTVKDVFDGKFRKITLDDKEANEKVKEYQMLMSYTDALLENYHEALKAELAEQGITI